MKTLGIIGLGNMGSCIAQRAKPSGFEIWVFDKDKNKTTDFLSTHIANSSEDLLNKVDAVILAIKPQDFDSVLSEVKNITEDKLIISIAAGITTAYIEKYLAKARIIRAMPNLLAMIGRGITFLYKNRHAQKSDLDFAKQLFDSSGKTFLLDDENMMDAATAITGSGPGYYCDRLQSEKVDVYDQKDVDKFNDSFVVSLAESAEEIGFDSQLAMKLARAITTDTIELLKIKKISPGELAKQITSKGGTTEAAIDILHKGGSLKEAVQAALKRARGLSKK